MFIHDVLLLRKKIIMCDKKLDIGLIIKPFVYLSKYQDLSTYEVPVEMLTFCMTNNMMRLLIAQRYTQINTDISQRDTRESRLLLF